MSEGSIEGNRGTLSLLRDRFKDYKWAEEIASKYNSKSERVDIVTERHGLVPVFLDRKAINELLENWRSHGGVEVGGWLIGEEDILNNHSYLHILRIIPDTGRGSSGDFHFNGPSNALNYISQRRSQGERTVIIGTAHTHPQGWSGRITGSDRDSSVFAAYEPQMVGGELWSKKRSHIVLTPMDNDALDVWQAKFSSEPWEKRLVRNGYFVLEPKTSPQGRVRLVG